MNINMVDEIEKADLITHSGTFHADEVFATVTLYYALGEKHINIIRCAKIDGAKENAIIYDIGGGEFDHHQLGGNGKRKDGVSYASFGLIWKKYGKKFLKQIGIEKELIDEELKIIDKKIVEGIDAIDNGEVEITSSPKIDIKTISDLIGIFNSRWDEDGMQDEHFKEAVDFANIVLTKTAKLVDAKLKARSYVEDAIEKSHDRILVLNKFMPWKEWLLYSENPKAKDILYVVYPSNRGGYNAYTVPLSLNTFENRKSFPVNWSGLRGKELEKVTGVKTATFCHNACFICGAEEKEDAIKLAKIAVES